MYNEIGKTLKQKKEIIFEENCCNGEMYFINQKDTLYFK